MGRRWKEMDRAVRLGLLGIGIAIIASILALTIALAVAGTKMPNTNGGMIFIHEQSSGSW